MRTHHAIDRGEVAAEDHVAIRLQRQGKNTAVRACAGIESGIQTSVDIESSNAVAICVIERGKITTDEHLAIWLDDDGSDWGIRIIAAGSRPRIEAGVPTPVSVQPGDLVAAQAIVAGEIARDYHLAI